MSLRASDMVPWKIPRVKTKSIDIFSTDLRFTGKTVFVVGSGPNGRPHWHKIPKGEFVFVINQAVTIESIPKSIWLCEDSNLPKLEYFRNLAPKLVRERHSIDQLKDPDIMVPVFGRGFLTVMLPQTTFTFEHGGMLGKRIRRKRIARRKQIRTAEILQKRTSNKPLCVWGTTFGGATISSRAVQIATLLGAEEIILCGIDMMGKRHFFDADANLPGQKAWGHQSHRFNHLIHWIHENTGTKIYSISRTALQVPLCHDYST